MTELDVRTARKDQLVSGAKSDWEVIIGLEVHAQVTSQAKLFSGASAAYGGAPNAHVSLVDAAMPGMLPVISSSASSRQSHGASPQRENQSEEPLRPEELFLS